MVKKRSYSPVVGFRLEPKQRAKLIVIAKEEGRSLSNLVSFVLNRFIQERTTKNNNAQHVPATENLPEHQGQPAA